MNPVNELIIELKEFRKYGVKDLYCNHGLLCECEKTKFAKKLVKSWIKTKYLFNIRYISPVDNNTWVDGCNDKYYKLMSWWEYMTRWCFMRKYRRNEFIPSISCIYNNFPHKLQEYKEIRDVINEFQTM